MSTYPTSLDNLGATNPASSDPMTDGAGHAAQHAAANDAIDAIQATLGTDPLGVTLLPDPSAADDDDVLKVSSGAWTIGPQTGGGGGGSGAADANRLWTPGSGVNATYSDEFDDATLDTDWVRVDASGGTGRAVWTEDADCLSLLQDGTSGSDGGAELHGLVRPYALGVGDYIQTRLSWFVMDGNYPLAGLVIADGATHGSGTQVVGSLYRATGAFVVQSAVWSSWGTRSSFADSGGNGTGLAVHLRLKRTASGTYVLYASPDGVSWVAVSSRTGVSMTPSHVGIACSLWGAAVQGAWSFAYFRVGS